VRYSFRLFTADLGGGLKGVPVNTLGGGVGDYRFSQKAHSLPARLTEGLGDFQPTCRLTWADDAVGHDGRLLFAFPAAPSPHRRWLALEDTGLRMRRCFSGEIEGDPQPQHIQDPHMPVGIVTYCLQLAPGQSRTLTFKLPLVPLPDDWAEARQVREADPARLFAELVAFWERWIVAQPPLRFPERKVQEYLAANTISNLLTIDLVGDDLIVNVSKFHYHSWFGGSDTTAITRAFEYNSDPNGAPK
jgi:hypothetical protein